MHRYQILAGSLSLIICAPLSAPCAEQERVWGAEELIRAVGRGDRLNGRTIVLSGLALNDTTREASLINGEWRPDRTLVNVGHKIEPSYANFVSVYDAPQQTSEGDQVLWRVFVEEAFAAQGGTIVMINTRWLGAPARDPSGPPQEPATDEERWEVGDFLRAVRQGKGKEFWGRTFVFKGQVIHKPEPGHGGTALGAEGTKSCFDPSANCIEVWGAPEEVETGQKVLWRLRIKLAVLLGDRAAVTSDFLDRLQ